MTLMLSNDDGVHAPGLRELAQSLTQAGYAVRIIAPDRDRSGASNSLTLDSPLHATHIAAALISINGTPTDAVHLGVNQFYRGQCERVISGINAGANLGDDVLYSGTVAAAMEGRFLDQTPIAISLTGKRHFATAARVLLELLPKIDQFEFPKHSVLNINVPDVPYDDLKGMAITRLGYRHAAEQPIATANPRGKQCYWVSAAGEAADCGPGTDFYAIEQGKVSITPLQLDMTHHSLLDSLAVLIS